MLDFADPLGIGHIVEVYKLNKWCKIIVSCWCAAFMGFFGAFSVSAGWVYAYSKAPWPAIVWGVINGSGLMAAAVFLTLQKSGALKELSVTLPKELETIVEGLDVAQPTQQPAGATGTQAH